jgi:hypothetical protein
VAASFELSSTTATSFDIKPVRALHHSAIPRPYRAASSVGIVANQPNWLGGILENDSADKAARFMQICDAFNVPLVFPRTCPVSWSA